MAMSALKQHALAPIASLRHMNPYVDNTLADLAVKGLNISAPCQLSGLAQADAQAAGFGELASHTSESSLRPSIVESL